MLIAYRPITLPLCNFGIAFSHAICVIVKYFGKLLLKTIWQPKFSPIFYYPGENRNLKSPIESHGLSISLHRCKEIESPCDSMSPLSTN